MGGPDDIDRTYGDRLRDIGLGAGLDTVGVAPADPFEGTRRDLEQRRADGLAAGMQFTFRRPARSTDPAATLAGARALVVGARSYNRRQPARPVSGVPARVAAYVWEDDYAELRAGLTAIAGRLEADGWRARVTADDNRLVDREAAHRAGLGWYGKNANLLIPGRGSRFVLGSVITDAPLDPTGDRVADRCGPCARCVAACPTGAIVAPGVIDGRRCLAWLVQAPGVFPLEHRAALGDRIYGCDDCQDVCPVNDTPSRVARGGAFVDLIAILAADDAALLERYGHWYIPRRDPRYLRRNALVALGNSDRGDEPAVVAALRRHLEGPDELLQAHAVWAARALGRADLIPDFDSTPSPMIQRELDALPVGGRG